jgi:hypothetical protein
VNLRNRTSEGGKIGEQMVFQKDSSGIKQKTEYKMARSLGGPGEAWAKEAGGAQLEEKTPKQKSLKG